MKKFTHLFLILFAFTSCEKDILDTEAIQIENSLKATHLLVSDQFFTVVGENDPLIDVAAVQNAVDNHDRVMLSGVFDFGDDEETGGVDITRPNIILKGPATIHNGAKYEENVPGAGYVKYPLSIRSPGVVIHDLEFIGSEDTGIFVYVEVDGDPVNMHGNTISAGWASIFATSTSCGIKVINNTLEGLFGYYAYGTNSKTEIITNNIEANICYQARYTEGETEVSNNTMEAKEVIEVPPWADIVCYRAFRNRGGTKIVHNEMKGYSGIYAFQSDNELNISENTISTEGLYGTGIWVSSWSVRYQADPEWGDNPPVNIVDNSIDIQGNEATGIMVGTSVSGINNVLVEGNTLTGEAGYGGLVKQPYGHNNEFNNNDLRGLTTYSPQLWIMGGKENHFINNKLGSVAPFTLGPDAPVFRDAATLISTANWHLNDFYTPDPVNYDNHFNNNDYRLTGVAGWSDNTDSFGAVLLLDFIQQLEIIIQEDPYEVIRVPYEEPFIMENFINEKKFPAGTDLCTQVLDLSNLQGDDLVQGNNHIASWTACEANAKKETYELISDRYKNFGQHIKDMNEKREKYIKENYITYKIE